MHAVDYSPLPPTPQRFVAQGPSLTHRLVFAWFHMRVATRRLITERPSEEYLLWLLMLSNTAFFFSWLIKGVLVPKPAALDSSLSTEIGMVFIAAYVGRTLVMYLAAMLLGAFCRMIGGRGTWRNTRIVLFWAALVAAPFSVLAAIASVIASNLAVYYPIFNADWIALPPFWFGIIPFVWFLAIGLSLAHGFRRTAPVFLYLSIGTLVALLFSMYLRANGVI